MNFLKYILLLILFLAASCNRSDDLVAELPPITQTGERTFGCYINGQLILPMGGEDQLFASGRDAISGYVGSDFENGIKSSKLVVYSKGKATIILIIPKKTGAFSFGANVPGIPKHPYSEVILYNPHRVYHTVENSGVINVTRPDPVKGIYYGTFHFKAFNKDNPKDSIMVTEGRFDMNFGTLGEKVFPPYSLVFP